MNEYTFSNLKIGMEEKFSYTVTQEKQNLFTQLSGDLNPMHLDAGYADRMLGFNGHTMHGGGYSCMVCSPHRCIQLLQEYICRGSIAFFSMWRQHL